MKLNIRREAYDIFHTCKMSLVVCAVIFVCFTNNTYAQCELEILFASDAANSSRFGNSVAIDGDVMVIGAHQDNSMAYSAGAAYIFRRINSTWIEEAKLLANDGAQHDEFGWSVDISGNIAIVGTFDNVAAYIFRFVPELNEWVEQTKLLASDGVGHGGFGFSVAISGTVAVVGDHNHTHAKGNTNSGAAYVFTSNDEGQTWEQVAELLADDAEWFDYFGESVDIDGNNIVIGAYRNDDNGYNSGSAYIFQHYPKLPDKWIQIQKLLPIDGNGNDFFGYSVAISEGVCAIGAYGVDLGGSSRGAAYIFRYNNDSQIWNEEAKLTASDGGDHDKFGIVGIDGNLVVVGAPGYSINNQSEGAVFVYEYQEDADQWIELGTIIPSNQEEYASLVSAVALDNGFGIVGSPWHNGAAYQAGAIYTFEAISIEDSNSNGIPDACENGIGDLNFDDVVDIADLQILLGFWGPCPNPPIQCHADLLSDGIVNTQDLLILFANWG